LLHCCCGPCATAVYERLARDYDLVCYWFNPNIQPQDEFDRRLDAMRQLADAVGMKLIVDTDGDEEWREAIAGLEDEPEGGARCDVCFAVRLRHAARKAAELGCELFTTTLTISSHKPLAEVAPAGETAAADSGVTYLAEDFNKQDGFRRSVELSKQHGLYRQRYCGCIYSKRDAGG
jgi:predicted adenine nucleotide alpha hydrolase (AANH) superfamily ATPase